MRCATRSKKIDTLLDLERNRNEREISVRMIAALASSFAAGPGIKPIVDEGAMRSVANYAHPGRIAWRGSG